MTFVEHIHSGVNQIHDALESGVSTNGNESNIGSIIGVSSPSVGVQNLINDVVSYPLGSVVGAINYFTGEELYTAPALRSPVEVLPLEQEDGFKMATTEQVTVTTTTAPKGGKKNWTGNMRRNNTEHKRGLGIHIPTGESSKKIKGQPAGGTYRKPFRGRGRKNFGFKNFNPRGPKKQIRSAKMTGIVSGASAYSARPVGNEVWFNSVPNKPGCLRIRCKIFIATLKMTSGGVTVFKTLNSTNPPDTGGQWYFSIVSFGYMGGGVVPRMAQYFDSWYQNGSVMEFDTLQNTNGTPYSVTWCFCDSADHWKRLGVPSSTFTPTKDMITYMSNSQTFAAWLPQMFIGLPPNKRKYQTATPYDPAVELVDLTSYTMADYRQVIAGTMGIRVDGIAPTVPTNMGDVFLHLDITLCDMSGLQTGFPSFGQLKNERKMREKFIEDSISQKVRAFLTKEGIESKKAPSIKSERGDRSRDRSIKDVDLSRDFDSTLGFPGEGPTDVKSVDSWDKFGDSWTFTSHDGKIYSEDDMVTFPDEQLYDIITSLITDQDFSLIERRSVIKQINDIKDLDSSFYMFPADYNYIITSLGQTNSGWIDCAESFLSWLQGMSSVLDYSHKRASCFVVFEDLKQYFGGKKLFSNYSYICVENCRVHGSLTDKSKKEDCLLLASQGER